MKIDFLCITAVNSYVRYVHMSKTKSGAKGSGNASTDAQPIKKPRYTRVDKRYAFLGALLAMAVIAFFACGDLTALATATGVCIAGTKLALLYASPDGSVKSGRAGSVVYMRNGRRRNFTVPSLVQNAYTQTVRNRFGTNSNSWSGLSDAERATWNNAVGFTYTDRFGTSHILKGKALYVRLNQNLANASATLLTSAPLPEEIAGLDTMTINDSLASNFQLGFTPSPTPADTAFMLFATPPLPAGFSRPSASLYRLIAVTPVPVTTGVNTLIDYSGKFGTPAIGTKIFYKVVMINLNTGQASPANIASAIVSA